MTEIPREEGPFRRVLGPVDAAALGAGSMIGTGIFVFVSDVAAHLPGHPSLLILIWLIGAGIAACGALCLSELAAADPRTGGIYVYLVDAYGPLVGFLYGWCKFGIMRVASFAIPSLLFAGFALELVGVSADRVETARAPLAGATVLLLTLVNMGGVRAGASLQVVLTAFKLLALLGILLVGALFAGGFLEARLVDIGAPPAAPVSALAGLGTAMIAVMWTYGGWDEAPFVAEEVRSPSLNLPRSILGGLVVVALLFVGANCAYLLLLGYDGLASSGMLTASLAMERALGDRGSTVMTIVLMVSTFGVANGMALTGARIAYAAGRDHRIFRWFARTNPRTRTPVRGLLVQCGLTIAAIALLEDPFTLLLFTGFAYWAFAGAMAAAVLLLRRRDPERPRPFQIRAYPWPPLIFLAAALGMCASVALETPENAGATLLILAVGTGVYLVQRQWPETTGPS